MKRIFIQEKLRNSNLFSESAIRSILNGTRKPSLEKAIILAEQHQIPFTAWADIKTFITDSNSISNKENRTLQHNIRE